MPPLSNFPVSSQACVVRKLPSDHQEEQAEPILGAQTELLRVHIPKAKSRNLLMIGTSDKVHKRILSQ